MAALGEEVSQQKADDHADGGEQRRRADEAHLASLAALALLLFLPQHGEVGIAVRRDGDHGAAPIVDLLHERAALDELALQIVVGPVGEGAPVHEIAVDGARCALVVQQTPQFAFLHDVEIDGGHESLRCCVYGTFLFASMIP